MASNLEDVKKFVTGVEQAFTISERISESAERWQKRKRWSAALLFFVASGLSLWGVVPLTVVLFSVFALIGVSILGVKQRLIDTREIVLRDDAGVARAWFRIGNDGQPTLHLGSKQGVDELTFTFLADGTPGIVLRASKGQEDQASMVTSVSNSIPYVMLHKDGERLWSTPPVRDASDS